MNRLVHGFVIFAMLASCSGSHFRGGTITWKSTGHGFEVEFSSKLGWVAGMYCSIATVGSGRNGSEASWKCVKGCLVPVFVNVNQTSFQCTGFNLAQKWERTEGVFKYTFPGAGPFEVEYSSGAWIAEVGGGSWTLKTIVDLRDRSDTGAPNHSPIIPSKPVYFIKYGCTGDIVLPTIDEDNDNVTCRWSVGNECSSICHHNGYAQVATLNEETCTLTISANLKINDSYAVAITIEDRPKTSITIGGSPYAAGTVISSVPLQFILVTPDMPSRN
ncbi:integrin beta-like protein A [Dreissena polymorpha]|nr:integrin beta-like protein A [Dreissena polymorpha]